jgi:flagellar basal body-associated protein FliL
MALAVMAMNTLPLGALLVSVSREGRGAPASEGQVVGPGPTLQLVNQVVQLRSGASGRGRHAVIDFDLELETDAARLEILRRMPQIRDTMITHLWQLTAEDLLRPGGLDDLKQVMRERLNALVPSQPVRQVFVVDFLVQ